MRLRVVYITSESGARFAFGFLIDEEPEELDEGILFEFAPHGDGAGEELPV